MIYLDMDGPMADFDKGFLDTFGVPCGDFEKNKKKMWQLVYDTPHFFANLPLSVGVMPLVDACLKHGRTRILTSIPWSNPFLVRDQKMLWRDKHFPNLELIVSMGGDKKPLYMQQKGDVLIDDWRKNTEAWEKHGGVAIKYENHEQAIKELNEHFTDLRRRA